MSFSIGQASIGQISIEQIRADFPLLSREVNAQPLAYLDSAASAQKPQIVIDRELNFYREGYAAVHRGHSYLERRSDCADGSGAQSGCWLY